MVVVIDEIGNSGFQKEGLAGMWVSGNGNVRLWVGTLHVFVEALLGNRLEDGCEWIQEKWNAVAENRWQQKAAQVHRDAPMNTKSPITYIPCPSDDGCDLMMPKHW
jgi:hypothetical protein